MWTAFIIEGWNTGKDAKNGSDVILVHHNMSDSPANIVNQYNSNICSECYTVSEGDDICKALSANRNVPPHGWAESAQKCAIEKMAESKEFAIHYGRMLILRQYIESQVAQIKRVIMSGIDGLLCVECNEFCAYVEPNCDEGYICRKHKSVFQ